MACTRIHGTYRELRLQSQKIPAVTYISANSKMLSVSVVLEIEKTNTLGLQ
jgi:hypothetical protein